MSEARRLVLVGGGGHALVVAEAAALVGLHLLGFCDDDAGAVLGRGEGALTRMGGLRCKEVFEHAGSTRWILAIGDLAARRRMLEWIGGFKSRGPAATIVHPRAILSTAHGAMLGEGVYVGPGAILHTRAQVGGHVIINSGAIVEHECQIGENAHIAPGAVLGGRVTIGADTLVGLGSRVLPGATIGRRCVIGAGAVVIEDVPDGSRVVGVPGRVLPRVSENS